MENYISNYVKNGSGKTFGLVAATLLEDGTYNIDYSICHNFEESFDKERAREIAYSRASQARKNRVKMRILDETVLYAYMNMVGRASRYFKGAEPSEKVKWIMKKYNYRGLDNGSFAYDDSVNDIEPRKGFCY